MSNEKLMNKLHQSYDAKFKTVLRNISKYNRNADINTITRAYDFSISAHKDQRRYSGEPYFEHIINVAEILAELKMDSTTISAGLLHDVVEDTGIHLDDVEKNFGKEIAQLVDGVTKISELRFESKEERQAENYRKMLLSMVQDVRVIIIKFADRLHNMRTLEHVPEKKRKRIAIETRDVYAPLAHRFGIAKIKWELEDLVLKHLDEDSYNLLNRKINQKREEREKYIKIVTNPIIKELRKVKIKASVTGRPKHFYSIYNKMQKRNKSFEEIYDLLAIRIIVNKIEECYYTLGIVHNLYMPVYDRFKDYIAMPKINGYQSLHTTVVGPQGKMVEIQIRTHEMHNTAEIGIAAHWIYKEGKADDQKIERHMIWLRNLVSQQMEEEDPSDFMENLKIDLFQDEVFVFSPKGDLFKLPRGSTPVDFAFAIHTDIGLHCIGAKVNGRIVPLKSILKSGDQIEILTSANQEPHQDWLSFVKTAKARQWIKKYIREIQHTQTLKLGEEIITKYLKKYDLSIDSSEFTEVIPRLGFKNLNNLLLVLGRGEYTTENITKKLFPTELPEKKKESFFTKKFKSARYDTGIKVQGINHVLINFGKCCQPVPGDKIIGFITKGRGITIHRIDCKNMFKYIHSDSKGKGSNENLIDVSWDIKKDQDFQVHLSVLSEDRRELFGDVAQVIAKSDTNILALEFKVEDSLVRGNLVVEVKDLYHLTKVIHGIRKVNGVIAVDRVDSTFPTT
jgi:guanosine-3',5'-bis(diphosphate) 3'-pyrophosphohydrolase